MKIFGQFYAGHDIILFFSKHHTTSCDKSFSSIGVGVGHSLHVHYLHLVIFSFDLFDESTITRGINIL